MTKLRLNSVCLSAGNKPRVQLIKALDWESPAYLSVSLMVIAFFVSAFHNVSAAYGFSL